MTISGFARVEPVPGAFPASQQTVTYVRTGGETSWRRLGSFPVGVVDIANRGGQLALLLNSGDWIAASEDSSTTGTPLPAATVMLAIAGDGDTLWSLGRALPHPPTLAAGTRPATAPATRAAATSSSAQSQPTDNATLTPQVVLFSLSSGEWKQQAILPSSISDAPLLRLSVTRQRPYVAALESSHSVVVLEFQADHWSEKAKINTPGDIATFKFLSGAPSPVLWMVQANGEESLEFLFDSLPPRSQPLPPPMGRSRIRRRPSPPAESTCYLPRMEKKPFDSSTRITTPPPARDPGNRSPSS